MAGPTYRTGGFGFAILDITQGPNMTVIEQKNFAPGYSSQGPLSSTISQQTSSLTLYDFAGLFLIIGSVTIFALFCSETPFGRKLTEKTGQFIHNCFHFKTSRVNAMENASADSDEPGQSNVTEEGRDANVIEHGEDEIQETGINNETSDVQNLGMRMDCNEERNL